MLIPLSFDLTGKEILLIGAGKAALEKFAQLQRTACNLTIVADRVSENFAQAISRPSAAKVTLHQRRFAVQDLEDKFMVFSAVDDKDTARKIFQLCRERRILINSADDREHCDFFTNALIERGAVTISVSTQGRFAGLSAILRRHLEELLPAELDEEWEKVFELRRKAIALQSTAEKKSVIASIVRDIEQKFFSVKRSSP